MGERISVTALIGKSDLESRFYAATCQGGAFAIGTYKFMPNFAERRKSENPDRLEISEKNKVAILAGRVSDLDEELINLYWERFALNLLGSFSHKLSSRELSYVERNLLETNNSSTPWRVIEAECGEITAVEWYMAISLARLPWEYPNMIRALLKCDLAGISPDMGWYLCSNMSLSRNHLFFPESYMYSFDAALKGGFQLKEAISKVCEIWGKDSIYKKSKTYAFPIYTNLDMILFKGETPINKNWDALNPYYDNANKNIKEFEKHFDVALGFKTSHAGE